MNKRMKKVAVRYLVINTSPKSTAYPFAITADENRLFYCGRDMLWGEYHFPLRQRDGSGNLLRVFPDARSFWNWRCKDFGDNAKIYCGKMKIAVYHNYSANASVNR